MNSAKSIMVTRRSAQLRQTMKLAEFEMMVAILSFSMLASYVSETGGIESTKGGPISTLQALASLIRAQK